MDNCYKKCESCHSISLDNGTCVPCADKSQEEYIKAMKKAGLENQNIIRVSSGNYMKKNSE